MRSGGLVQGPFPGDGGGGGEAVAPSLVLYRESVTTPEPERYTRCPRKAGFLVFNHATGEAHPARCKAVSCPFCGPIEAMLVGGAIALAGPQRQMELTQVGDSWQTVRTRVRKWTQRIREQGYDIEWCYHVEPNPKGTGHHLHGFQRGSFIPQEVISRTADGCGMGRVAYVQKFEAPSAGVRYGVKMAGIQYGLKMAEQEASMSAYLRANGGRLVHASRGFWRVKDQPVGLGEAKKAWAREHASSAAEGTWTLIRAEHLSRALASVG